MEGVRAGRVAVDLHRDLLALRLRRDGERCSWPSGSASARSATRSTRRSRRCARPAGSARRCRPTVTVAVNAEDRALLASLGDDLKFVFDHVGGAGSRRPTRWRWQSRRRTATKCERCWHWRDDVGARCRASGALRALHQQPLRRGRNAQGGLMRGTRPRQARACGPGWAWRCVIVLVDQVTKTLIVGYSSSATAAGDALLQHRAGPQHRRGVLVPGRGVGLAALVLRRPGRGGRRLHRLDAEAPRGQTLFCLGARADPGRRARQRDRPAACTATWSTSSDFHCARLALPGLQRGRQRDHRWGRSC